ncbi:hypothetical protein llap_15309 [Limosa lapponica baueri]|uniref:Uncharacterized protein n=1 Tax=Limosa lapponica baueri TaxID=1758121 RepID=A0A2I0TKR7_LIMLA|nr:hypothetical protein llap_15309 [Limosa lapponica baueri]
MLSRENVGYASTCNSVGQTAGYFLGNVLFLALESASFCNKYLRFQPQPQGIVTLSDYFPPPNQKLKSVVELEKSQHSDMSFVGMMIDDCAYCQMRKVM